MTQNGFYLSSPLSRDQLVDIFVGKNRRVVFAWKRSKEMSELYRLWNEKKPDEE